jgi:hypothetical protein
VARAQARQREQAAAADGPWDEAFVAAFDPDSSQQRRQERVYSGGYYDRAQPETSGFEVQLACNVASQKLKCTADMPTFSTSKKFPATACHHMEKILLQDFFRRVFGQQTEDRGQRQQQRRQRDYQRQQQQASGPRQRSTGDPRDPLGHYKRLGVDPGCSKDEIQASQPADGWSLHINMVNAPLLFCHAAGCRT